MALKLLVGAKQLQLFLKNHGFYEGNIDGIFGPKSIAGAKAGVKYWHETYGTDTHTVTWSNQRWVHAATQAMFQYFDLYDDKIDGLVGPNTQYALELWQNSLREQDASEEENTGKTIWPTYSEMTRYYGKPGTGWKRFVLPYKMQLAWDTDTSITRMTLHEKCGDSAMRVFELALSHYGMSGIKDLRLDLFGGSGNVRLMRGGTRYSVHSWAAAIDIDPMHNQLRWSHVQATLDNKEYNKWWGLWEDEGWVSLGRERNYDWMHVQACRL